MAEPFDVPSGQFRLAQLQDPFGNTIMLSQLLTQSAARMPRLGDGVAGGRRP